MTSFVLGCICTLMMSEFSNQPLGLQLTAVFKLPDYNNNVVEAEAKGVATVPIHDFAAPITNKRPISDPVAKLYYRYWLLASKSKQVAITIIPKVMCTSIRAVMNGIECSTTDNPRCAEGRRSATVRKLPLQNYTRVVFFRDPFERVLSTYKNSEINPYIQVEGCAMWKECKLDYWVDRLVDVRSIKNEHFLPQSVIAQRDKMHYHYHFRMSNSDHIDFFFRELLGKEPVEENKSSNSDRVGSVQNSTSSTGDDVVVMQQRQKKIAEKFEHICDRTLINLLLLYEDDFQLWESMLASSPRGPGEYTMYDYYKDHLEDKLQEKVAQHRLTFQRSW
ncbi:sulfotransferase family protein [Nitzschia inconspicua]|uniref:Sulfotransferase family protein n=1 Tax=Nitzschia inconspicua TaxID=303405 RepID=A0A9K3LXU3_9STRA|nr:sulfotransferase family protein [Nitzschia inconspicua]